MMAFDFKAALKKKWVKVALITIAVGGVFLIFKSRAPGSSSTAANNSTGLDDAQAADMTSLEEQQNQIQAASAAQASSIAAQESEQSESDQTGLTALQDQDSTQISLAGIQLQGLQDQYNAETTQNSDNDNAEVSLANITANEQTGLASITANEQTGIANIEAGVANTESNNATKVAITNSNNQANVAITQSNNSSGGGCFITTAICEFDGKSDDCYELRVLRNFRDLYMRATPERAMLVELYYATAPSIVDRIDDFGSDARREAYEILRRHIDRAIAAIGAGDDEKAARIYIGMLGRAAEIAQ
jgi:hypothetical protein